MHNAPLLTARTRLVALIIAALGWAEALTLGVHYAGAEFPGQVDRTITRVLRRAVGGHYWLPWLLSLPASPVLVPLVLLVVAGLMLRRGRWELAALAVIGPGVAVLFNEFVLKPAFDRHYRGYLSYPSGHTTGAVAALTVLLLAATISAPRWRRMVAGVLWLALSVGVMVALVTLNVHYPTDTLGGAGVALGVVLPAAVLLDLAAARSRARAAAAHSRVPESVS